MSWVNLPIPTDEGPLDREQRAVLGLSNGETCKVRVLDGEELDATCERHRSAFRFIGDDGEPLDVAAVFVPQRSGRSLTAAERAANGQALLQGLWLPTELVARLDAECERRGLRRTALVRTALEEWLESAR